MSKCFVVLLALALAASPAMVQADQPRPDDLDQRVHCAAVFAVLARSQATKQPGGDAYPPIEASGRAFFVATGQRLFTERQFDEAAVRTLFKDEVGRFQQDNAAAKDPQAHFAAAFRSCQHYLPETAPTPAN